MGSAFVPFRQIGIAVPQDVLQLAELDLTDYLKSAERHGYDGLWVSEANAPGVLDPLTTLSYAAAVTATVRLGIAVLLSGRRSPVKLAREIASIDQLSNGRVIMGVGLGKDGATYPMHGLSGENRAARFEAGVVALKQLWTEGAAASDTQWWRLKGVDTPLATVQKPHPPIWFGARKGLALKRAVRLGSGWIGAGSSSLEEFEKSLREVQSLISRSQPRSPRFDISKRIYVYVGEVDRSLMTEVESWFQSHYGDASLARRSSVLGSAEYCLDHLRELARLGVGNVILHPVARPDEQMRVIAKEVLPVLRDIKG